MTQTREEIAAYWTRLAAQHYELAMFFLLVDDRDEGDLRQAVMHQELASDYAKLAFTKRGLVELVI